MPDLTDLPRLKVYELLKELEAETGKPLIIWLHRIAVAAINHETLKLRPDDKWRIFLGYEKKYEHKYREPGFVRGWSLDAPKLQSIRSWQEPIFATWKPEASWLSSFLTEPNSRQEPPRLEINLNNENIEIHRDDFRQWLEATGQDLPRFWFGEAKRHHAELETREFANSQPKLVKAEQDDPTQKRVNAEQEEQLHAQTRAAELRKTGMPLYDIYETIKKEYCLSIGKPTFKGVALFAVVEPEREIVEKSKRTGRGEYSKFIQNYFQNLKKRHKTTV